MPSRNGKATNRRLWRRIWMNPALTWGCEISPAGVSLARWEAGSSGLEAAAWRPLSEGAVVVSPLRENVQRPEEVREALTGCLEALGRPAGVRSSARSTDVALVIPDQAARLFFLDFDSLPHRAADALPLMRWRLKKSVPFDIETSVVSYFADRRQGKWQVVAVVLPEVIIRQYEALAEGLGLKPRFVTLSTLGSLGLVPASLSEAHAAGEQETWQGNKSFLVAKCSPPWFTTAIVREGSLCLFRTTSIGDGEQTFTSLAEVLEAIYPSLAYFQDNYGVPLDRAYLCGFGGDTGSMAESVANELHLSAAPLLREQAAPVAGWDRFHAEQHLAALLGIAGEQRRG